MSGGKHAAHSGATPGRPSTGAPAGTLYLVATPIGNLDDISARARAVLSECNVVAAEDTRHTSVLLRHLGMDKPMTSLHEHNEAGRIDGLLRRLQNGESVAVVCDAGTPLISDPGFDIVRAATQANVRVVPIPGACAAIVALAAAGLPTDRFTFEGFLPAKSGARRAVLQSLMNESRTMVFYEAPHRLRDTLLDLSACFGAERLGAVARELTKQFESIYRGTLADLAQRADQDKDMTRGEIVIVVAGAASPASPSALQADAVLRILLTELPPAQAAKLAAKLTGLKRADLYAQAIELSSR